LSGKKSKTEELPPAPWGSFPLAELTILAGIVMLAIGIFGTDNTALGIGIVLAGLGGLEVAIREHFAGFRSHTTLLAGLVFVVVVSVLFFLAGTILAVALAGGALAFVAVFLLMRRVFRRASGGLSFMAGRRRP
jgi:hypothetical protein